MFLKTLKPIRDKNAYSVALARAVEREIYFLIYKPLLDLLSIPDVRTNSSVDVLVKAFEQGKIYYENSFVYGSFNAPISKTLKELGGKFNKVKKAFKIDLTKLPPQVKAAMAKGKMAEQESVQKVKQKAMEMSIENISIPDVNAIAGRTLNDLHEQFQKVTPDDLGIPVEMSESRQEAIKQDYIGNLNLRIKDYADGAVERLRYRVVQEVGKGTRAENLKDILQAEYGMSSNHVRFIARQETSLFVARFRQVRYEEAGINQYRWSTSSDERVRPDHRVLDNKIFSWDQPPISNRITGDRNNPGQDYGCRCVALPVVKVAGVDVLSMVE